MTSAMQRLLAAAGWDAGSNRHKQLEDALDGAGLDIVERPNGVAKGSAEPDIAPPRSPCGRASAAEVEVHVHDLIAEALGQEGVTYSGVRRAARDIIKTFSINGVAQASPQHDHRVYFGCECCEEHAPENGVNCREDIGVMPDGTWLCDGCYSDCDKSTYGMVASDIDDFEFPRFEDLPRPAPYGASPIPSTEGE